MNNLIKGVLLWVIMILIVYLSFVFVTLDLNFKNWSKGVRLAYVIISGFSSPFIDVLSILKRNTKKK
jgi:DMSO/TMAO reductase YedYZ heme-binding membrane subunit